LYVYKPGGIIKDNPVAEKLLMTDLARWPPKLEVFFDILGEGGRVGHKLVVTGKLRNSSFFSIEGSSDSFSDKLLGCLKLSVYVSIYHKKKLYFNYTKNK